MSFLPFIAHHPSFPNTSPEFKPSLRSLPRLHTPSPSSHFLHFYLCAISGFQSLCPRTHNINLTSVPLLFLSLSLSLTQTSSCSGWKFLQQRHPGCWRCWWLPQAEGRFGQQQVQVTDSLKVREKRRLKTSKAVAEGVFRSFIQVKTAIPHCTIKSPGWKMLHQ